MYSRGGVEVSKKKITQLPQLRLRSEYSFRSAYGSVDQVAEAAQAVGATSAGLVDTAGTWGHVSWQKAALKAGIEPLFGSEFVLAGEDGVKRSYWALAEDLPAFYRFASSPPRTETELAERKSGIIVFAGAALSAPDAFDFIDINPRSRMSAERALALNKKTGKPLAITSDCDYPMEADRERFLAWNDSLKMTPQHILTIDELRAALWYLPTAKFNAAVKNTAAAAERAQGCRIGKAPLIEVPGNLRALAMKGKKERLARGHIQAWTSEYEKRLQYELKLIKEKSFESYFLVVADMISWAKDHMLVGPARGSSAGSLVCYLLRITEIDPLVHELIFERFIDVNRSDLPDIDSDFNDSKRDDIFVYLAGKYGTENTARIGSVNRLKPRSVMAHVGKKLGIPAGATFPVLNVLIEYSSGDSRYGKGLEDTLTITQPGKDFMAKYPEAAIMTELENHASHTGVHAAGFIVSNRPVIEFCTVRDGVAQIDKKDAEELNLLKMDVLGLRTLGIIEDSGVITAQELYDLPLNDPEVFKIFNEHKFSCLFQFEGPAQRRVSMQIPVKEFQQIDHITALARPGPLGGGAANTYINRNAGREPVVYRHESMEYYLKDTRGVVLYQEQVMRIAFEIGKMPWAVVSEIRKAMSGRKGKEYFDRRGDEFVAGAKSQGITEEVARTIWGEIVTFGAWGMNKSHTVSYSVISYWCAYLKRYHALEYAAACLRNAKDDEQTIEILRELRAEGVRYIPFDADKSDIDWRVVGGSLIGGFRNLVGLGPVKAARYVSAKPLTEKNRAALSKMKLKYSDLAPAHTLWGEIYARPEDYNINGPVKEFADLQDFEEAVVICNLVRQERRDENETVRVHRRGHKKEGQTLFLDAFVVDDSVSKPVVMRFKAWQWEGIGQKMADRAVPKKDWFVVRGKWLAQFSMFTVIRIKCLTNKELFI
jgi:DNA polymerase III alpha subunit